MEVDSFSIIQNYLHNQGFMKTLEILNKENKVEPLKTQER